MEIASKKSGQNRVQALHLIYYVRTERVPHAANHKRPDQVELRDRPRAILMTQPRVPLHQGDRGFEQVEEKRQNQNEESAARLVDEYGCDREKGHGRDDIPVRSSSENITFTLSVPLS